jgi:chemosensory pili system protein ChpA (sensor histidine kinase/response regulator)
MFTSEDAHKAQKLYKQTLLRLGEMLKILKKGNSSRNRELLRGHCDYLSAQGKKQNLFAWVDLMEIAKAAIIESKNDYQTTTKLIIKEIKNAGELLLKHDIDSICVSDELKALAPQMSTRFNSADTVFMAEDKNNILSAENNLINTDEYTNPFENAKQTLEKDLWHETIAIDQPLEVAQSDNLRKKFADTDIFGQRVEEGIFDISDDDLLTEWLEEDDFEEDAEDENEQISAVFVNEKETLTGLNEIEEIEAFSTLFEDKRSNELQIDQWESSESEAEIDSLLDILNEEETAEKEIKVESATDDLFSFDLKEPAKKTMIVENETSELDNIINSLDDLDLEDDFPSAGTKDSYQILTPVKPKDTEINFYDQFDDLQNLLSFPGSWQEIDLFDELNSLINNDQVNYYEDYSELDRLINSSSFESEEVDWQELNALVQIVNQSNFLTTAKSTSTISKKPESLIDANELSELDQLLAQVGTEQKQALKWKSNANRQVATKTNNQTKVFEQSMRVPVKQLDNLNNLIGEIVVRRNRLEEDQDKLRQFLDNLLGQVQSLTDVSSRMQDLYERSLLEGSLIDSRRRNQAVVRAQLARVDMRTTLTRIPGVENTNIQGFQTPELDELELDRFTGFHLLSQEIIELIVKVRESSSDIQFLVDETDQLGRNLREITTQLQEGINKSRMVPFAQNADRLPLPIRKIAESYHKQVQLKLEGREVLIDKMILDHIWDPLLQITKNSVTHGIELPKEREALGKPAQGIITVRAFLQGQQTVISVSDDGAGIDPQAIKKKAIQQKLITPADAQKLKPQDIYDFLFTPGFTTKEKADSHAGRGVGLDIVRSKLNEIRGIVSIDSTPGVGSTFTIRLPLTVTVGKALCCLNDNTRIAFPMDAIEETKDFSASEIQINAQGQKCIIWNNELLSFRPLSTLLKYNRQVTRSIVYTSNSEFETIPIVILRSGNNLLAVQVDEVLGQEEIVIKQFSGPLPKPKGISGATVRSDGIVMPIADVIELMEIAQGNLTLEVNPLNLPTSLYQGGTLVDASANIQPLVLIVDDSITVREMLSLSFSKAGYRVEQARDGQEAWQKLRSGLPCDLVFCDIEMPRMNGLELLQNLQNDENLAEIPVAILSSRGAEKHKMIAAELGASDYFVKPYVEKDLIDSAKRMINGEVLLADSTRKSKINPHDQGLASSFEESFKTTGGNNISKKSKHTNMVLIIDDSVVVREMLSMTFKKAGYQVEQARDGQEAWDKVSGGLPCDLLLCDIEMPRMNGLELLAKMQQDQNLSKLPVAMVTSRGAEKHRKIAADLGAKAYFTKPYLEEELLNAAKRLIKGEVLL